MAEKLKLRKGCKVSFPEKLFEGYTFNSENSICANVSADKIDMVMAHFICMHDEPLFFILEIPSSELDEKIIRPGVIQSLHNDVYYIDGCSREEAIAIIGRVGELMINDGFCCFGFGGHESQDEIMFGKYNVTDIYSKDIKKYSGFFEEHDIYEDKDLITAWDTFDSEHPGYSEAVKTDGRDIYDIPAMFSEWGIYKDGQREV